MNRIDHLARAGAFRLARNRPKRFFERAYAHKRRKLSREQRKLLAAQPLGAKRKQRAPLCGAFRTLPHPDDIELSRGKLATGVFGVACGDASALFAPGDIDSDIVKLHHRPGPAA